jgi:hypothetical protein
VIILKVLAFIIATIVVAIVFFIGWFNVRSRSRRQQADGIPYIYVTDQGTARELTLDEQQYLNTEFEPTDGARPYIKSWYDQRTPTGSLRGFLLRRQLPPKIKIDPSPKSF